ncbi:hypothetical protein F7734_48975 [Scytonema sp. UIC 10036]|uniref:hypothetical protein n=1 Tax=Scytonema sp. UIC 10036 TaxID=2304196 RepID=UPI0012DAF156|nr:hypothetical protein [Scytonema sp. UIC 10036]MUG99792.1 hypothetical protein [Scytonema sp. UIC 10036]
MTIKQMFLLVVGVVYPLSLSAYKVEYLPLAEKITPVALTLIYNSKEDSNKKRK